MANGPSNAGTTETNRIDLKSYRVILPMGTLSIGVDNIHYDVFLSPKFVQTARDYLFDLIRQNVSSTYFTGIDVRSTKQVDSSVFRKMLTEMLQNSLNRAKYQKNIEIDVLFRLAILKFLSGELLNQFANVILDGKEHIRKRGEYFERSQQAHVIKARLSEMQSARRDVIRLIGQQVAQIINDTEENVIAKGRRALFGEDFNIYYELLKNKLIFLDGNKDDFYFLEHYVLLGNYARDPDRIETMDELFQQFLAGVGVSVAQEESPSQVSESYKSLFAHANGLKKEISALEEERDSLGKRLDPGGGLFNKILGSNPGPQQIRSSIEKVELRLKGLQQRMEEYSPQLDSARQQVDYVSQDYRGKLGDYLNEPENAKRLFDPSTAANEMERSTRTRLLAQLTQQLEDREVMPHILASYEIRPIANGFCPPVHLQQLRKALVSKEEYKRVEEMLKQVPTKRLTMKPLEELTKRMRRYSREDLQAAVLRFAGDFLRLRRDLRDAEHLSTCMERINLLTGEKVRELSRMNNRLYECLLKSEARPEQDQVVSHVIIKADVRGSTKMTQDLLARGLSPASHFSLNLHEPVKRLLDRYAAKKVFIEGDAIVLAIFETEGSQAYAHAVAKACMLSRQILVVCNSYNDRAVSSQLPALEIGIGVAYQGSAPTYWTDGESKIMISKALNLSDRLSGCAKLAKRMLAGQESEFALYQFLTAMEGASAEELDEFLVRYNMNGIELNAEGFEKLSEEISLEPVELSVATPWGKENATLYWGEVPMGESVEVLLLRKAVARQLLPDGKIGPASTHNYYEVCTSPALYELVASLKRSRSAAMETSRV
jgi:class 3 adenylate cyclase